MQSEIGFLSLISDATFIVQLVLLVLIIASVLSWSAIIAKWREFRHVRKQANQFEERFWSGMELSELYKEIDVQEQSGMAKIFHTGFDEYIRLHKQGSLSTLAIADTAVRSMKVALSREVDGWNKHLNFLSVVASTSPYIGLFGTVWGIMHAFLALQDVQPSNAFFGCTRNSRSLSSNRIRLICGNSGSGCIQSLQRTYQFIGLTL